MKTTKMLTILVLALGLMVCSAKVSEATPMGTAWTYQGRLIDANTTADGEYDFSFRLYDANTAGSQVGSDVNKPDVDLIDGYFTVELDFGSSVFDGNAVWLEIGVRSYDPCDVNAFTTLQPRTELTPVPYALQTRGIFVDDAGKVGIGTTEPETKLHVESGGAKAVFGKNTASGGIGVEGQARNLSGGGVGVYGNSYSTNGVGVFGIAAMSTGKNYGVYGQSQSPDGWAGYFDGRGYFSGNVGIGMAEPTRDLHIYRDAGPAQVGIVTADASSKAQVIFGDVGGNKWTISSDNTDENKLHFRSGHASGTPRVTFQQNGNVGIGTTSPETKLHIAGGSDASLGGGGYLVSGSEGSKNVVIDENEIIARNNGNPSKLYLNMDSDNVVVSVLEIMGGSDLAEPFEVAGAESIEPGMVVAIDSENPGKLVVSSEAYDRKVAGIISGAGGIKAGMLMGQKGSVANGANPVALTGRVYCLADAAHGAIQPGDLLTTSETPGHAMKVTDYSKAHGAILGKAMSSLDQGQGLVLVLVTLQ